MPIHQLVDDVQMMNTLYHFVDDWNHSNAVQFESGSWAVARKGRYKGDVGLVVDDDRGIIDPFTMVLVMFIPRVKLPSSSLKRPSKLALDIDFRRLPIEWKHFEYVSKVQASCPQKRCSNPLTCSHETPLQKRYKIFGQVIRGGFALQPM